MTVPFTNTRQAEWTTLTAVWWPQPAVSLDPAEAGFEIFTLKTEPCIPCAIKQRRSTRAICWSDVNR